jgi:hypothetical protein
VGARRGGVAQGQSTRLIIELSVVRVHPPLLRALRGRSPASFASELRFALNSGPGCAESPGMNRHCPRCATEVEDRAGYCALGHRLRLDPVDSSIDTLRAELDQVFEAARLEVSGAGAPPPPPAGDHSPIPPAPPGTTGAPAGAAPGDGDDIPSTEVYKERARGVWAVLEEDISMQDDPIEAFAPPPRMDWGPERSALVQRLSHPRRPSGATV